MSDVEGDEPMAAAAGKIIYCSLENNQRKIYKIPTQFLILLNFHYESYQFLWCQKHFLGKCHLHFF